MQIDAVNSVLAELEVQNIPTINVWNKVGGVNWKGGVGDMCGWVGGDYRAGRSVDGLLCVHPGAVLVRVGGARGAQDSIPTHPEPALSQAARSP